MSALEARELYKKVSFYLSKRNFYGKIVIRGRKNEN